MTEPLWRGGFSWLGARAGGAVRSWRAPGGFWAGGWSRPGAGAGAPYAVEADGRRVGAGVGGLAALPARPGDGGHVPAGGRPGDGDVRPEPALSRPGVDLGGYREPTAGQREGAQQLCAGVVRGRATDRGGHPGRRVTS